MQTLQNVGPDSPYGPNDLVNPSFEDTSPQTNCTPLTGWEFTMGRLPDLAPLAGPWGSLTVVGGAFPPVTTEAQTALLNENGEPTGNDQIAGATTFELTQEQLDVANEGQWALRLQGGTPTDPVLAQKFFESMPGDPVVCVRGAALRQRQQLRGQRRGHLLPGRHQAHLLLRVPGAPAADERDDHHPEAGHRRAGRRQPALPVQREHLLRRQRLQAGERRVDGLLPRGRQDLERHRGHGGQLSAGSHRLHQRRWDEHFHGQRVDRRYPSGEGGSCHLRLCERLRAPARRSDDPQGDPWRRRHLLLRGNASPSRGEVHRAEATTTQPGVPVDAVPSLLSLAPGRYVIAEQRPRSPDGRWHLRHVSCNGASRSTTKPFAVEIRSGQSVVCTFVNSFVPRGSISIAKITEGGVGTASFVVTPATGPPTPHLQNATTTTPGVAADAKPQTPADATGNLRLGTYHIVEQPPLSSTGDWTLTTVVCNGVAIPFAQGTANIELTRKVPDVHCVFTNAFSATQSRRSPRTQRPSPRSLPAPGARARLSESPT